MVYCFTVKRRELVEGNVSIYQYNNNNIQRSVSSHFGVVQQSSSTCKRNSTALSGHNQYAVQVVLGVLSCDTHGLYPAGNFAF